MNYRETIEFLFSRLPMFSRTGADAYRPGLDNILKLCNALNNPQHTVKTVHIAGTNGKGSTSHMLAAILQQAGFKTGLYTSPHLKDFRERIKLNGEMIPEQFVVDFTGRILPLIEELQPSFFEITVAMAFSFFAEQGVDIAVIETGLGGRLDSTNIIIPEVSVITNIGFDHMNMLGNTLEAIAGEKAGIIKENVPVVIGEPNPVTLPVFEQKAKELNAPLHLATQTRQVMNWQWEKHELVVETAHEHATDHKTYQLDLPGIYQTKNLLTVLETCTQLQQKGWKITEEDIKQGIKHSKKLTGLHGRWEVILQSPQIVLDVAHNKEGIEQLLQQIELTPHRDLHIVMGMVKDKDADTVLSQMPKHARYYFTKAQIPRAMPESELQEKAIAAGLSGKAFSNVNFALFSASQKAGKNDLIVVCGSVFLVGEVSKSSIKELWGQEGVVWQSTEVLAGLFDFFT